MHRGADEGVLEAGALFGQLGAYSRHLLSRDEVQFIGEDEDHVRLGSGDFRFRHFFFLGQPTS